MSLLDPIRIPELSPAEAQYQAATMPTPFGRYLGESMKSAFDFSISGRLSEQVASHSEGGPLPPGVSPDIAQGMMGLNVDERRMSEDEWRRLKLDRPGLEFSGGGTVEYETARTRAFDERRYRDLIISRYQGGILGKVAGFGAGIVGSLPSPENFIPFVGPGVRAAMVARMGVIGGHAAAGALDATLGTVLADAVVLPDLARRGEDVGAADFALDVALGAAVGGMLGTGSGLLARRADARVRRETLTTAARAVRLDGLERQADALEVAQRALADDAPVDVGPVLADALPAIQKRVEQSYIRAYHGSPHRFDRFSMDSIGTGEGAQAYGHGLYFAEHRNIAEYYKEKLSQGAIPYFQYKDKEGHSGIIAPAIAAEARQAGLSDDVVTELEARLWGAMDDGVSPEEAIQHVRGGERVSADPAAQKFLDGLQSDLQVKGNLYTVDLSVSRDELLDWDKPLSEQPAKVREALENLGVTDPAMSGMRLYNKVGLGDRPEMGGLFAGLGGDDVAAAKRLRAAGIKGIQYLDAGSRGVGEGSRNIVMLDDSLIHIREVNGKAVEMSPQPHPSIIEAEAAVAQAPPKTGVEEAQRLAKNMGLEEPPELADVKVLKRDGLLSAADEAELERAAETVKDAQGWAAAYQTLSTCVLRYS